MTHRIDRRVLLRGTAAASFAGIVGTGIGGSSVPSKNFTFVHFSETHITDRLRAREGIRQCFERINKVGADFAIAGGDLVYDVCATGWRRAVQLYGYYKEAERVLELPVKHVMGNHDVFGLFRESGVATQDIHFGKILFTEHIGKLFYSFDHKGWHFIILDSVELTADRQYRGRVSEEQLHWLAADLEKVGRQTPTVVVTHIPLVTAYLQYGSLNEVLKPDALVISNSRQVWSILRNYNVKAVLQGHLHIREVVNDVSGCQFITSGAVCGNWWRGPREGHPEGFSIFTVRNGQISWRYQAYGFRAESFAPSHPDIVDQSIFSPPSK